MANRSFIVTIQDSGTTLGQSHAIHHFDAQTLLEVGRVRQLECTLAVFTKDRSGHVNVWKLFLNSGFCFCPSLETKQLVGSGWMRGMP